MYEVAGGGADDGDQAAAAAAAAAGARVDVPAAPLDAGGGRRGAEADDEAVVARVDSVVLAEPHVHDTAQPPELVRHCVYTVGVKQTLADLGFFRGW